MPRKVAKNSPTDVMSLADSVSVVKGSIKTVDDPTALDVKLSIWATEITMRADGAELGNWPTGAVVIRPIDAVSFEFIAEGDRLIFAPNNPSEFAQHPIVVGTNVSKKRKRSRANKRKPPVEAPVLRWDETTDTETKRRKDRADRSLRDSESQQSKSKKKPAKPSRVERRAVEVGEAEVAVGPPAKPSRVERRAAKAAMTPEAVSRGTVQPPPEIAPAPQRRSDSAEWMGQFGAAETPVEVPPDRPPVAAPAGSSSVAVEAAPELDSWRHRSWIRAIDFARQHDLFGLDRVPINPSQRDDPNHSHTWNHRVAPTGGPGKYLCTICGAIRRDGRGRPNQ